MNLRERVNAIMDYKPFDRQPLWYFGEWAETRERWLAEGAPKDIPFWVYFGMDHDWEQYNWNSLRVNFRFEHFETLLIEETTEYKIERQNDGVVRKTGKGGTSISQDIETFIKDRASWREFIRIYEEKMKGVDPHPAGRLPKGYARLLQDIQRDILLATVLNHYGQRPGNVTVCPALVLLYAACLQFQLQ